MLRFLPVNEDDVLPGRDGADEVADIRVRDLVADHAGHVPRQAVTRAAREAGRQRHGPVVEDLARLERTDGRVRGRELSTVASARLGAHDIGGTIRSNKYLVHPQRFTSCDIAFGNTG